MGQHHLHMFPVDYRNVKDYLVLGVLFVWLRSSLDSLRKQVLYRFCLNSIFLFYQATFKFVTEEFPFSVIRDFHWPWISDQPSSFYQVFNNRCFLVIILRYFKPPSYGVYHCNGF